MQEIHAFFGLNKFIDKLIVHHKRETLEMPANDGVMDGSEAFIGLEVDVLGVPDFFKDELDVFIVSDFGSQHESGDFFLIDILEISTVLD
jgi:hypothetical protein